MERSCTLSDWIVYWYIALLARPPKRRSCTAWRNAEATGRRINCGRRRSMIRAALILRCPQRLERNEDGAGIGGPTAAGKCNHIRDGRIVLDHAPIC